jgi:hypothetical protein
MGVPYFNDDGLWNKPIMEIAFIIKKKQFLILQNRLEGIRGTTSLLTSVVSSKEATEPVGLVYAMNHWHIFYEYSSSPPLSKQRLLPRSTCTFYVALWCVLHWNHPHDSFGLQPI